MRYDPVAREIGMTEYAPLVFVVEDDEPIVKYLRLSLRTAGYRVVVATTAAEAVIQVRSHNPDLILVDLGLPDRDGLEVIGEVRGWSPIPIVVVSARDQESQKIRALDAGADDYVTKPFTPGELLARIRAALRRTTYPENHRGSTLETGQIRVGDCIIDLDQRTVFVNDEPVHLTPLEYRLLVCLAHHRGRVLTHRAILEQVWGPGSGGRTEYLRVFVAGLRRKLEPDPSRPRYLRTEIGVGYRLLAD